MIVILDSNILIADFHLAGTAFETLRQAATRLDIQVIIPQPAIDEVTRHYRLELEKNYREAAEALSRLSRINGDLVRTPRLPRISADDQTQRYREQLSQNLAQINARIRPYPAIDHNGIVRRLIARRKPFKENGAGYIDTLIWESLLEVAREANAQVFLISDNVKDFGGPDGNGLADDLVQDIRSAGLAADSTHYYRSLRNFIEVEVAPLLAPAEEIVEQVNQGEHRFLHLIQGAFPDRVAGLEDNLISAAEDYFRPVAEDEVAVQYIEDEHFHIHATAAQWLSDTLIRLDFQSNLQVSFDFFIDKSERWNIDLDRWNIGINDPDWNEWVIWVSSVQQVSIVFTVVIDVRQSRITAFDAGETEIVPSAETGDE